MNGAPAVEASRLRDLHERAGAVFATVGGAERARHYGDPAGEYAAAVAGTAVVDRGHLRWLAVSGREPGRMLAGLITGRVPAPLVDEGPDVRRGRAEPSALLTARGRMITDLRVLRAASAGSPEEAFLLGLPPEGLAGASEHFRKFLPPRLAAVEDVSRDVLTLTVLGPGAARLSSRDALGLRMGADEIDAMAEGDLARVSVGGGGAVTVVRTADVAAPAWDLVTDPGTARALWSVLVDGGARPTGTGVWETLRVEAGRPAYGADMDERTIPIEAGIHRRVVDYGKGCFTGQEVIVRIRDRGHVNRHLRGLRLGDLPAPRTGTELFRPPAERPVGKLTSVAQSPRFGGVIALGWVRREVEPPAELRVGSPDGPPASVHDLDVDWRP